MASIKLFRQLALEFPEVTEQAHFEKTSFRVNKKIFVTLAEETGIAVLKLSLVDQSAFCSFDPLVIYAVENKWGRQGWTIAVLKNIKKTMVTDLLTAAYCEVAPAKLAEKYIEKYKRLI